MATKIRSTPTIIVSEVNQDSRDCPHGSRPQQPSLQPAAVDGPSSVPPGENYARTQVSGSGRPSGIADAIVLDRLGERLPFVAPGTYDGWMAPLCSNPFNDCVTCCLACWVPCAQFGKTHWRLGRRDKGEDPLDSAWRSEYGCNGCCWAWLAVADFGLPCILTMVDRTRIRATYGIKGDIGSDLLAAWLCQPCTLIQNDQEVRAREGVINLRQSKGYKKHANCDLSRAPPPRPEPMRYMPPMSKVVAPAAQGDGSAESRHSRSSKPIEKGASITKELKNPTLATKKKQSEARSLIPQASDKNVHGLQAGVHALAECNANDVQSKKVRSDSALSDSDTIYGTSRSANAANEAQELSYIHDFADCPVDKSVLEHYEKEEKKAQLQQDSKTKINQLRQVLAECSEAASTESNPKALRKLESELQSSANRLQSALAEYKSAESSNKLKKSQAGTGPDLKVKKTRAKKALVSTSANDLSSRVQGDSTSDAKDGISRHVRAEQVAGSATELAKEGRRGSHEIKSFESQKSNSHRLMSCPTSGSPKSYAEPIVLRHVSEHTSSTGSDDSQATKCPVKPKTENDKLNASDTIAATGSSAATGTGSAQQLGQHSLSACECLVGLTTPDTQDPPACGIITKPGKSESGRLDDQSAKNALAATLTTRKDKKQTSNSGKGKHSAVETRVASGAQQQVENAGEEQQATEAGGISGFFRTKSSKRKGHS